MTREEKSIAIENLTAQLAGTNIIYVSDISGLNAETTSSLRRACFKAGIKLAKAMEASANDYGDLPSVLTGNSAIFISDVANAPGKIIKDFRKKSAKPVLKGAYINSEVYIGDDQLDTLATIKSKEELLGELIGLLQSPAQRIISALQNKFAGSEEETEA
jgi:large subunit ribosomal protein L10